MKGMNNESMVDRHHQSHRYFIQHCFLVLEHLLRNARTEIPYRPRAETALAVDVCGGRLRRIVHPKQDYIGNID